MAVGIGGGNAMPSLSVDVIFQAPLRKAPLSAGRPFRRGGVFCPYPLARRSPGAKPSVIFQAPLRAAPCPPKGPSGAAVSFARTPRYPP
jgi:hypothetical protein